MEISLNYKGNMRFASEDYEKQVVMDAAPVAGRAGEAPTPKKMLLYGLAGCTGMDIAAILKKKKVKFENFKIEILASQNKFHPVVIKEIKINFIFKANPDDRPHIERAIELSEKQFCGVSEMLRKTADITWKLTII